MLPEIGWSPAKLPLLSFKNYQIDLRSVEQSGCGIAGAQSAANILLDTVCIQINR